MIRTNALNHYDLACQEPAGHTVCSVLRVSLYCVQVIGEKCSPSPNDRPLEIGTKVFNTRLLVVIHAPSPLKHPYDRR